MDGGDAIVQSQARGAGRSMFSRLKLRTTWPFYLIVLPAVVVTVIFNYVPILGIVMAFQDYKPWLGVAESDWIGFDHFRNMFWRQDSQRVIGNTIFIALFKIVTNLFIPYVFALLLNEVRQMVVKRSIQTLVYLPLSMPAVATLSLFTMVFHWNSWFDGILYVSDNTKYPLATFLQTVIVQQDLSQLSLDPEDLENLSQRTVKAAQIFIGALPILMVYPFLQKYFVRGIVLGAVKE